MTMSASASVPTETSFAWRMQQQQQQQQQHNGKKYQLFPKDNVATGRSLDPEQAFAMVMGQHGDRADRIISNLKIRRGDASISRRRKISVPNLGLMAPVQEVAMDSPTIPGRPPLHERASSVPETEQKQFSKRSHGNTASSADIDVAEVKRVPSLKTALPTHEDSVSPRTIAPILAPSSTFSTKRPSTGSRLRCGSLPASPGSRRPHTPATATQPGHPTITTELATSGTTASYGHRPSNAMLTPLTAPLRTLKPSLNSRNASVTPVAIISAMPVDTAAANAGSASSSNNLTVITPASAVYPDSASLKSASPDSRLGTRGRTLRRLASDSCMMQKIEHSRSRKKSDGPTLPTESASVSAITSASSNFSKKSKRTRSAERRAFEQLPRGWKAAEAAKVLGAADVEAIHTQAMGQALRFHVLKKSDVDSLSKELRHLDERTEYLRKTYSSLRAGRRNTHMRMIQSLRSPNSGNKLTTEAILKQEESLVELDLSIEEWANKLEQAENRRLRVRQKLLEHVAAALLLPTRQSNPNPAATTLPNDPQVSAHSASATTDSNTIRKGHHGGSHTATTPTTKRHSRGGDNTAAVSVAGIGKPSAVLQTDTDAANNHFTMASMPSPDISIYPDSLSTPPRNPSGSHVLRAARTIVTITSASTTTAADQQHAVPLLLPAASSSSSSSSSSLSSSSSSLSSSLFCDVVAAAAAANPSQCSISEAFPHSATHVQALPEHCSPVSTTASSPRQGVESIRIYADSDVYALFQDVEDEISKMSSARQAAFHSGGGGFPAWHSPHADRDKETPMALLTAPPAAKSSAAAPATSSDRAAVVLAERARAAKPAGGLHGANASTTATIVVSSTWPTSSPGSTPTTASSTISDISTVFTVPPLTPAVLIGSTAAADAHDKAKSENPDSKSDASEISSAQSNFLLTAAVFKPEQ